MNIRAQGICALIASAVAAIAGNAIGADLQNYPTKPIRVIIPAAPGSNTDIFFRVISPKMGSALGQNMIADYRPGAGGMLGASLTSKATADGYTLALVAAGFVMNPSMTKDMPYDPTKDFSPLGVVVDVPSVLVVHPSLPARNLKELLALAKAKPGTLNYGTSGQGTNGHLGAVLMNLMANVQTVHVPYKSSAPAIVDLMAGHIEFSIASIPAVLEFARNGKLRMLAQTGLKRSPSVPNIPTMNESGLPGYYVNSGFGLLGPAGLPHSVVDKLNGALVKSLQDPGNRKVLLDNGADPVGSTPDEHAAFNKSEVARWIKVARAAGIKPE